MIIIAICENFHKRELFTQVIRNARRCEVSTKMGELQAYFNDDVEDEGEEITNEYDYEDDPQITGSIADVTWAISYEDSFFDERSVEEEAERVLGLAKKIRPDLYPI